MIELTRTPNNRQHLDWHTGIRLILDSLGIAYEEIAEEHYEDQCSDLVFYVNESGHGKASESYKKAFNLICKETRGLKDLTEEYLQSLKQRILGK